VSITAFAVVAGHGPIPFTAIILLKSHYVVINPGNVRRGKG